MSYIQVDDFATFRHPDTEQIYFRVKAGHETDLGIRQLVDKHIGMAPFEILFNGLYLSPEGLVKLSEYPIVVIHAALQALPETTENLFGILEMGHVIFEGGAGAVGEQWLQRYYESFWQNFNKAISGVTLTRILLEKGLLFYGRKPLTYGTNVYVSFG